ncbi:unnamed protein product [Rotaria sp. Silwood1]|nr:unnamed protein product [Rotaria sp. Silwood1]
MPVFSEINIEKIEWKNIQHCCTFVEDDMISQDGLYNDFNHIKSKYIVLREKYDGITKQVQSFILSNLGTSKRAEAPLHDEDSAHDDDGCNATNDSDSGSNDDDERNAKYHKEQKENLWIRSDYLWTYLLDDERVPNLQKLVKFVFSIPVSNGYCETVFSHMKYLWNHNRNRMKQNLVGAERATCSWPGHCAGDPCTTENDCDGSMICITGKCGTPGGTGCTQPCTWIGHCCGDSCQTENDCDGSLVCVNGKCSAGSFGDTTVRPTVRTTAVTSDGSSGTCSPSGVLRGTNTNCNTENMSECCQAGKTYDQYRCSPSSTSSAILTLNSFQEGGDGGGAGACFGRFYPDTQRVVALSTGWYNGGSRCGKTITINGNGRTTTAVVVDECDSVNGCDAEHAGQPPCRYNIVDGSPAVWAALGVPESDRGEMNISWSD